jgi:hypothetical protein
MLYEVIKSKMCESGREIVYWTTKFSPDYVEMGESGEDDPEESQRIWIILISV